MIFVSAGHHPFHPGISWNGLSEHDVAVEWRDQLVRAIGDIAMPVPVGIMRDKMLFLNGRHLGNCFALEFHLGDEEGGHCLYHPDVPTSQDIANKVQRAWSELLPGGCVKPGWYDDNPQFGPDFFLTRPRCPSVLLQVGSIHQVDMLRRVMPDVCRVLAGVLCAVQDDLSAPAGIALGAAVRPAAGR